MFVSEKQMSHTKKQSTACFKSRQEHFNSNSQYLSATRAWEWKAGSLHAKHTRTVEVAPTSYTFEWFQRGHQLKATNMSLECEPTQLKVLHECIRGISCELALWIHKAVFIPPTLSLIQEAEGEGSFWSQPVPLFFFSFFLSLGAKEDWVSLICSLYIWMSSAKSSSWPPDKGPGAETVAVPNLASVGAVNHQGLGGPFEDTSLLYWLICGQKAKPFSPAPFMTLSLSLPLSSQKLREAVGRSLTHNSLICSRTLNQAAQTHTPCCEEPGILPVKGQVEADSGDTAGT